LREPTPQCRAPWIRGRDGDRGLAAAFSRRGSGPPLLLLHGAGLSARTWEPVADLLDERYDLLIPDLPGFGQSAVLSGLAPNVANLTDAVARWLQTIGVEQPHVAGISLGGALALELGFRGVARSVTALSPVGFATYSERLYAHCAIVAAYRLAQVLPSLTLMMAQGTTLRPLFSAWASLAPNT
jgi:pimeloyl-ACP methyl ester carboxylesterase